MRHEIEQYDQRDYTKDNQSRNTWAFIFSMAIITIPLVVICLLLTNNAQEQHINSLEKRNKLRGAIKELKQDRLVAVHKARHIEKNETFVLKI